MTGNSIVNLVAERFEVEPFELAGRRRDRYLVRARMAAAWCLRTAYSGMSYEQIGRLLKRDHTSVMYQVRTAEQLRVDDLNFKARTDAVIRAALGELVNRADSTVDSFLRECGV